MKKKGLVILLVLVLTMAFSGQAFAGSIALNVNGNIVSQDISAQVILGKVFVPLKHMTEKMGGKYAWDNKERQATVIFNGNNITTKNGEPFVKINGVFKLVKLPSYILAGNLMVSLDAVEIIFNVDAQWNKDKSLINLVTKKTQETNAQQLPSKTNFTLPNSPLSNSSLQGKVIVIDPGHGGSDPGAIGPTGVREKDVTLAIGKKLYSLLLEKGAKPIMTRNSDVFVDLAPRAQIANNNSADIFISIHTNSAVTPSAIGIETFSYIYSNSSEGSRLARSVQTSLVNNLGLMDRGVKRENFSVLRNSRVPAILAELAFISNPKEERLLADPAYQQKAAEGLMQGILNYYQ